jgi:endo-1,4-beta-xylanase
LGYGVHYRLDFCDKFGVKQRVDILKKDYAGLVIPFIGSGEPFKYTYKNEEENKFNQITTSEATVSIISNPNISLDTFYTEDEREWMIRYYAGEFVANNWDDTRAWDDYIAWEEFTPNADGSELKWAGFLLPDSSSEPFRDTYQFDIKAKDVLGTLKDVPYANNTVLIKKVDSLKNILGECLRRTDLELNFVIGVNTFETTMDSSTNLSCPLEQTFIDTNRLIDTNNKPYSVYDVILHICNQFTANVQQVGGKWYFIDVTEKARDSFYAREYAYKPLTGSFDKVGTILINSNKTIFPNQLVNADHSFEKEPAYKTVSSYYQYGYLSNKVNNGNFNVINPSPLINPFPGWSIVGGMEVAYGQKSVLTPQGDILIEDYYLKLKNQYNLNPGKFFVSDPISVLTTTKIGLTMFVQLSAEDRERPDPGSDYHVQYTFKIALTGIGETPRWWNGRSWVEADTVVQVDGGYQELYNGTTVSVNIGYPQYSGAITIGLSGVQLRPYTNTTVEIYIDEVQVNLDESQYYRSAIGNINQTSNIYSYSKSPDPVILLFGDDENKNRTSWMRVFSGTPGVFNPTRWWHKKGIFSFELKSLQRIVARNILVQHQKPSRRFEGTLRGSFSPLDTLNIPLTEGKFVFISGTFYAKSSTVEIVASEIFTEEFTQYAEASFEDFGEFKDAKGSQVGSSSGVSLPTIGGGQADFTGYAKKSDVPAEASPNEMTGMVARNSFVSPFMFGLGWSAVRNSDQTIRGWWNFEERPSFNEQDLATLKDLLTLRDVLNKVTGQTQDAKIFLDVVNGKNVVGWEPYTPEDEESDNPGGGTPVDPPATPTSLKQLGAKHGTILKETTVNDPVRDSTIITHFTNATIENLLKPSETMTSLTTTDFAKVDLQLIWLKENGINGHGHTCWWPGFEPQPVKDVLLNPATTLQQAKDLFKYMIQVSLLHVRNNPQLKGSLKTWDIVNEPTKHSGDISGTDEWKYSEFHRFMPAKDWIKLAFVYAHEAYPEMINILNDYDLEYGGKKVTAILNLVAECQAEGIPLHGIGWQFHRLVKNVNRAGYTSNLIKFVNTGLKIHISEVGLSLRYAPYYISPGDDATQEQKDAADAAFVLTEQMEEEQAIEGVFLYGEFERLVPYSQQVAFTWWGRRDQDYKGNRPKDFAMPFNNQWQPKKVYAAMIAKKIELNNLN